LEFLDHCRKQSQEELDLDGVVFPWDEEPSDESREAAEKNDAEAARVDHADSDKADQDALALLHLEEAETLASDGFVEVGDTVTFCYAEAPAEHHTFTIIEGKSDPVSRRINENTAVAQALLGLCQGDEGTIIMPDNKSRKIRVLKVGRSSD
jgi:transcription elongation GreA/GreB family factor